MNSIINTCTLAVLIFVPCAFCVHLKYVDCGSSATVHSIKFEPCAAEECTVYQQHNYTAWINFTARVNHDKAFNFASGDVVGNGGRELWNFSPNDACNGGVKCPIQAGLAQMYTATVTVPITNPKRMAAKWEIKTENDRNAPAIICFVFPITIM